MDVELVVVAESDKAVLANLVQLYQHDFSEIRDLPLTRHGTFTYAYLDHYFTEPAREAYFIEVGGELAGFALARADVDKDGSWNVAEFFVARGHRRRGVARAAARSLFARHPGTWTLTFDHANVGAAALWRQVAASVADGPVTEVDRTDPVPATRLRFRVA
ncbi:putative acetyltransferase [Saccharothrix saharensis]|uniref:Putative acetyltransferase n=1 Tax=Saccharothrix saharensis TaxID=571190 RepID=A0A543JJ85_9PSEU|nr:putative acetyltransferase [Saccharothrix saharensis]